MQVARLFRHSRHLFTTMQSLVKEKDKKLPSFLRKLRLALKQTQEGEALLLPLLVEGVDILLIFEAKPSGMYRVVVVNTDPENGLQYV